MKIISIFALALYLLPGCTGISSNNAGYLENPQPRLREALELETAENPLEIVEKQAAEILKLKMDNRALGARLAMNQASQTASEVELEKLRQQLSELKKLHQEALQELDRYEKLCSEQEQKLVDLNIAKVKAEQEVVKLKIEMLKSDREKPHGIE